MKSDVKQTLVRYRFHLAEINHISSSFCSAGGKKKTQTCFAQNKDILEISVPYSMVSRCASCRGGECEGTLSCYARVVLSSWSAAQEFPLQQINKTFQLDSAAGKEKETTATKGKANRSDLRAIVRDDPLQKKKSDVTRKMLLPLALSSLF